jgi:hypothetical protein
VRALLLIFLVACEPKAPTGTKRPPPPLAQVTTMRDIVGTWRWILKSEADGTASVEDEHWYLARTSEPGKLVGRYTRDVEIRSTDGQPFRCNQRPWYRQRAVFDVTAQLDPQTLGFAITETDVHTEPSPCDHGIRHTGSYTGTLDGEKLTLAFGDGGTQTLLHTSDEVPSPIPSATWEAKPSLYGPWRWDATSFDDDGNLRDETEWWELVRRSDTRIDATYRRRVVVRSPDKSVIACANGPSWRLDDAYILEGQREEEHWRFVEVAVEPGDHPCMRTTPRRALDEMTAEQIGDYLMIEWRGKRRQVLHRVE